MFDFTFLVVLGVLSLSKGQEIQNGVCVENQCRELPPGEDCSDQNSENLGGTVDLFTPPGCPLRDCVCPPCDSSLDIPLPTVEVELHHATETQFVMTITWNQTQSADMISGYTVILSGGQSDSCQDIADLSTIYCTEQCTSLPPTATTFNFTYYYRFDDKFPKVMNIEVIPQPACAGATIQVERPKTCHYVRPGDCTICGEQDILDIHPPLNVTADPSLSEDGRTMDVDISWQILDRGYYMQRPYSSMTFYVTVKQHPESFIATPVLEVVGKTDVTLHNLNPCTEYSVEVEFNDCGCSGIIQDLYSDIAPVIFSLAEVCVTGSASLQTPTTVLMTQSTPTVTITSQSFTSGPIVTTEATQTSKISQLHTTLRPTTSMHTTTATELSSTLPEHQPMSSTPLQSTQTPIVHRSPITDQSNDPVNYYIYSVALGVLVLTVFIITLALFLFYYWHQLKIHRSSVGNEKDKYPPTRWDSIESVILHPMQSPSQSSCTSLAESDTHTLMLCSGKEPCTNSLNTPTEPSMELGRDVSIPKTDGLASMCAEHMPSPVAPPQPPKKSVLLVYSEASPQREKEVILECLVKPLHDPHGVKVEIYDTRVVREAPASWLPIMVEKCDIVLCVCDEQFQQEWMGNTRGPSIVYCLRQLINAAVNYKEEYASKYAVVLMRVKHRNLIPSPFLKNCREFIFHPETIAVEINTYVKGITSYQLPQ